MSLKRLKHSILRRLLNFPYLFPQYKIYNLLGVNYIGGGQKLCSHTLIGDYKNLYLYQNAEINSGCFIIAKDKIKVGTNSTIAYGATILTSANPNGPYNKLSNLYPKRTAPVVIGDDVWIGAKAIILPGVQIGDFSVVAAGSVVIKDVPSGVLVAGNPAEIKKKLR